MNVLCSSKNRAYYLQLILCFAPGVLREKKKAEDTLKSSGLPYTIIRPGRLTDGPYTSFDLNTLLKANSGSRQAVQISQKDDLQDEASRIAVAGACCPSAVLIQLSESLKQSHISVLKSHLSGSCHEIITQIILAHQTPISSVVNVDLVIDMSSAKDPPWQKSSQTLNVAPADVVFLHFPGARSGD